MVCGAPAMDLAVQVASLQQQVAKLQQELLALRGSSTIQTQLEVGFNNLGCVRKPLDFDISMIALPPEQEPPGVPSGLRAVTVESAESGAQTHRLHAALHIFEPDPAKPGAWSDDNYQYRAIWSSPLNWKFMQAPDAATAVQWITSSVNATVPLRNQLTSIIKSYVRGQKYTYQASAGPGSCVTAAASAHGAARGSCRVRSMVYHDKGVPADIMMLWFIPCVVLHEGKLYEHAFVTHTSRQESSLHIYENVINDHIGFKFTPGGPPGGAPRGEQVQAMVSVTEVAGNIILQNAASTAAFGMQEEVHAVTAKGKMFSKVVKITSPVLRHWLLPTSSDADIWHQVQGEGDSQMPVHAASKGAASHQISRARDPTTMDFMYVVAQVDVTSAVLTEHKVNELQAENLDLHLTTAWLEDQKRKADEINERLKESLVEALAARDEAMKLESLIDTDSPADKAIQVLNKLLEGREVTPHEAMAVRDAIVEAGTDLLQPVNLRAQMGAQISSGLDEDVGRSLLDMLITHQPINISQQQRRSLDGDPRLHKDWRRMRILGLWDSAPPSECVGSTADDGSEITPLTSLEPASGPGSEADPLPLTGRQSVSSTVLDARVQSPTDSDCTTHSPTTPLPGFDFAANASQSIRVSTPTLLPPPALAIKTRGSGVSSPPVNNLTTATAARAHLKSVAALAAGRVPYTPFSTPGSPSFPRASDPAFARPSERPAEPAKTASSTSACTQERGHGLAEAEARGSYCEQVVAGMSTQPQCHDWSALAPRGSQARLWGWDPFALNEATGGRPLSALCFALLKRHHTSVLHACKVDEGRLARFLIRIEDGYLDNPYHNRIHASDVLQWLHVLMVRGGVLKALQVGDAGVLATYLAAAVHDVGHKGLNNDFLVKSGDPLALLYNDLSPMENHHLATTFQLMTQEPTNFLIHASSKVRETLRKQMIAMVLATDMRGHFTHTSLFKSKLGVSEGEEGMEGRQPSSTQLAPTPPAHPSQDSVPAAASARSASCPSPPPQPPIMDDEAKSLALSVGLKVADLGNLAAPEPQNVRWVAALEEEYFRQGDREQELGLPVSALMQRGKAGVSKSQTGFCKVVSFPLFRVFVKAFPDCRPMLDSAVANFDRWRALEEEARRKAQLSTLFSRTLSETTAITRDDSDIAGPAPSPLSGGLHSSGGGSGNLLKSNGRAAATEKDRDGAWLRLSRWSSGQATAFSNSQSERHSSCEQTNVLLRPSTTSPAHSQSGNMDSCGAREGDGRSSARNLRSVLRVPLQAAAASTPASG
ncbi:hypothetical protein V8C86DRAFT_3024861 [Haematococcus lacustris]